ncbi:DUF3617 domain-containing protein [Alteraurantiacibacter aquimixticola]|uniref:DUF3617 domain-containing protein n=1 Tax=Alteraurantiacibacter aquimixticola TaxID=2489173 RepID=A0A4T3F6W8_9SPHN|nr:DUF3617 domain-containing protein [Alteraurantiacibacter aquimixticola]TIX50606.1 DUF3617 domain-containing protein [Alteraurantiacibacter aquimixticola]
MRKTIALATLASLALAACGNDAGDGEAMTADEMADAVEEGDMPQPGLYSSTQELIELSMPGVEDDMLNILRSAFEEGAQEESTYCLTPEEAANAREEMLKGMAESDCTITRMNMSGGNIDAAMSCPTGQGVTGDVTLTGTMASDGADMEMAFVSELPGMGDARIRMRVKTERIGECS